MIQVGINKIIFVILGIFLLKISFLDPIMTKKEVNNRKPASVRRISR